MKLLSIASVLVIALVTSSCGKHDDLESDAVATPVARGVVHGHVRVTGAVPPNEAIHMNADPMCVRAVEGNVSQPTRGMVNTFHPHDPGILRLKCDVHTWMVAFVGVVNHPYFAVTSADGSFALRDVPEGTYELRAWHERLGTTVSQVRVDAARESNVEMTHSATR